MNNKIILLQVNHIKKVVGQATTKASAEKICENLCILWQLLFLTVVVGDQQCTVKIRVCFLQIPNRFITVQQYFYDHRNFYESEINKRAGKSGIKWQI